MMLVRNKQNKKSKKMAWVFAVFAVLLMLGIFFAPVREVFSRTLYVLTLPAINAGQTVGEWWSGTISFFKMKNSLQADILKLKDKNIELETKMLFFDFLQKENEELKNLFSATKNKKYALGYVVARPPQSPYDVLIVDVGSGKGVKVGAPVTLRENILIGYVNEVFPESAKIKMISFPGSETNAFLPAANLAVTAAGLGGGGMEIKLPISIEVKFGDVAIAVGVNPLILGTVERVERGLSDPFQKIFLRLPINMQELRYVMVENGQ